MSRDIVSCLLEMYDQAFHRKSWHGTNLRGSIRRVTPEEAVWRPRPDRHCIADIVLHCAYWKYAVRRRFTGENRGVFAMRGSNWFTIPHLLTETQWTAYVALLDSEHRVLRKAITELDDNALRRKPEKSKVSNRNIIQGIIAHDLYHAGQIQILKRLQIPAAGDKSVC